MLKRHFPSINPESVVLDGGEFKAEKNRERSEEGVQGRLC